MVLKAITVLVLVLITVASLPTNLAYAEGQKIYVAIIWHYHQPWYYSPDESNFTLPWVRMHSIGNYYKMAYILDKYYPEVKVTFTFSGSLLMQILDYVENGKMDTREALSWKVVNGTVTKEDVYQMLRIPGGFFDINWARIVNRSPRYRELRDLAQKLNSECLRVARTSEELIDCIVNGFTGGNLLNQTVIDLATLFNLLWIDPQVAREEYPRIYGLMEKAYSEKYPTFTVDDLKSVLETHRCIMKKIIPTYKLLVAKGRVELIPVPYGHPIAPLLTSMGMEEDLEHHVRRSIEVFKQHFNYTPRGVWPAEQAVNEYAVKVFRKAGILWTVTDSTVLSQAGVDVGSIENLGVPWYIDFPEGRIYVFFRETEISNLISFQYSGWDQEAAVGDLVRRLVDYGMKAGGPRLVVIALDGENPWEHYPEFGTIFLNKLYSKLSELQKQGIVETITPGEFVEKFPNVARSLPEREYRYLDLLGKDVADLPKNKYGDAYGELPRRAVRARLPEGSWGGDLSIWIGHRQENVAWMWLLKAREDVMRALDVKSFNELYAKKPEAAEYIMRAQTSCWYWWYGGDGGGSPAPFDPLFKAFLARAYELAGLTPPDYLRVYAYPDGTPRGVINLIPPTLLDKQLVIDGVLEDTWKLLVTEGKAVEILVGKLVDAAYVSIDRQKIYMALLIRVAKLENIKVAVYFATPSASASPFKRDYLIYPRNATVDLAIHLSRELLIDPVAKKASVSKVVNGTWTLGKEYPIAVGSSQDSYVLELSVEIDALELARGEHAYFVIAVYSGGSLVEWSSRLDLAHQLYIPETPVEVIGKVVLDLRDPEGDDNGPGGFEYPQNPVFKKGVFDLVRFMVIDAGDKISMKFYFATLGGNPWGGPNGWSLQQIHVYIKTALPAEGKYEAIALNIDIEHGWHMALLVGPGWGTEPLPNGERTALYYYDKESPLVQDGIIKAYADLVENAIVVEISKDVLYDLENIMKWIFVVAVTSHDGYGTNKIRPFTTTKGEWNVYVPPEYAMAILNQVLPFVLDILAPTSEEQYAMLRSFGAEKGIRARVRGVSIAPTTEETTTTPPAEEVTPPREDISTPQETVEITKPSEDYWIVVAAVVVAVLVGTIALIILKRRK